jgi:hypothetical protein
VDPDPKKRPLCDEILSEVCNWQLVNGKEWSLIESSIEVELGSINTVKY